MSPFTESKHKNQSLHFLPSSLSFQSLKNQHKTYCSYRVTVPQMQPLQPAAGTNPPSPRVSCLNWRTASGRRQKSPEASWGCCKHVLYPSAELYARSKWDEIGFHTDIKLIFSSSESSKCFPSHLVTFEFGTMFWSMSRWILIHL